MDAFMKTESGYLLKAYERGDDWQVVITDKNGRPVCERWVTIWRDEFHGRGYKRKSLEHAFLRGCEQVNDPFSAEAICTVAS